MIFDGGERRRHNVHGLCLLTAAFVSSASPFAETSDLVRPAPTPLEERNENTLLLPPVQEHSAARRHRGDQASAARGSGGTRSGADSGSSTNRMLLPPHAWRKVQWKGVRIWVIQPPRLTKSSLWLQNQSVEGPSASRAKLMLPPCLSIKTLLITLAAFESREP